MKKKKSINKPHLSKHLLNGFKLRLICCDHCAMPPPPLGHATKQKSAKYPIKLPNQITIKHACGRGIRYLTFLHHFNQLGSRNGANFRFFSTC